jgi:hypothetical protein
VAPLEACQASVGSIATPVAPSSGDISAVAAGAWAVDCGMREITFEIADQLPA